MDHYKQHQPNDHQAPQQQQQQHRVALRQVDLHRQSSLGGSRVATNRERPKSMYVTGTINPSRDLSPSSAPLWRNAPSHVPPSVLSMNSPPASVLFQQSLRSYPNPRVNNNNNNNNKITTTTRPSNIKRNDPIESHVTTIEGEQSTPFYLDYLDSQTIHTDPDGRWY
ncbi:hypothetical protein BLOT_010045 [Blomia tropicalis]|nr:hypothetical protein BLOT_010045 [Blomia tropicalis]